ncbi:MAG: S-adenosyl-l-methionine hydroxide adenosyltransferase family protein [Candidatus Methanoperedens sp.]|nr:S-adenosyl-l-methionine hydroxide adenosyltransferase family protein [Candidatus Methanoperedens sp.]MCE8425479.1 S-adenosyl-l-methionine hydroxide adenosyltransferase family protein [Candidatus Methanoperedens sp.]MCE8427940.1 S-adenosyl-l-methionine hydroxide adenosyltransferase family protein [Candidatus Methanoperedens sp.]
MVITLLSDFGDVYPASMKGVILCIDPEANIVDISHSVRRHDIRAGAFILMITAKYFPNGTAHIVVVDPGVGTKRRAIAVRAVSAEGKVQYFVGPDNGILIPAAKSLGDLEVFEISNCTLFQTRISNSFHGRDIFAPAGAYISRGLNIEEVGRQISDFVSLDFGTGKKENASLSGEVVFIDSFGNMVTNISSELVDFKIGDELVIERKQIQFNISYGFCEEDVPLLLIGSHGYLEIAVRGGDAAKLFMKNPGDEIIIEKRG